MAEVTKEMILQAIVGLEARMEDMREEMKGMREEVSTKADLEAVKEELRVEVRALGKAIDKDAVTVLDHEKRLRRIEKELAAA